jgi:biotin carboxyl carrier protein
VPEPTPERRKAERRTSGDRTGAQRAADHAAIDRLAGDLLPALVAKLGASGLGELEVREGPWKVRLRRPGLGPNLGRRATDRASRAQPGHAGHGHAPGALEGHRPSRPAGPAGPAGPAVAGAAHSTNGSGPPGASSPVPGPQSEPAEGGRRRDDTDQHRTVATSPAVGIFRPRKQAGTGARVRSGDPIGVVDVLGIPQEIIAPVDGVVGESLVEAGEAVEYGQELIVIELVTASAAGPSADAGSGPASG